MSKVPYAVPRWAFGSVNFGLVQPPAGQAEAGFKRLQTAPAPWFNYLFNSYGTWLAYLASADLANWTRRDWSASPAAITGVLRMDYDDSGLGAGLPLVRYLIAGTDAGSPTLRVSTTGVEWDVRGNASSFSGAVKAVVFGGLHPHWWIALDGTSEPLLRTGPATDAASALTSDDHTWDKPALGSTTGAQGIALDATTDDVAVITGEAIWVSTAYPASFSHATHPAFAGGETGKDVARTAGGWVALGSTGKVYVAPDLSSAWTLSAGGPVVGDHLAAGDGLVVAYLYDDGSAQSLWVSDDDGATWEERAVDFFHITRLRFSDGVWLLASSTSPYVWQSNDLVTWVPVPLPIDAGSTWSLGDLVYGDGWWIGTGEDFTVTSGRARLPRAGTWQADETPQYLSDAAFFRGVRLSVTPPTDGQVYAYDDASGTFVPTTISGGASLPTATAAGEVPLSTGAGTTYAAASLGLGGLREAKPAADAVYVGRTYYATDYGVTEVGITDGAGHYGWEPITGQSGTVAALLTGNEGDRGYATDGRKVGEGSGSGTGVPVYYSAGAWRRYSDDTAVSA